MSTTSLGSMFKKRESVLTAEEMRIELKVFMTDTLQSALEELAARVKGDVREELQLYFNPSAGGSPMDAPGDEHDLKEEFNEGLGQIRMSRVRPWLGHFAINQSLSRGQNDAKLDAEWKAAAVPERELTDQVLPPVRMSLPSRSRAESPREFTPCPSPRDLKKHSLKENILLEEDELDESSYLMAEEDDYWLHIPRIYGVPLSRRSAHVMSSARDILRSYVQRASFENAVGLMVLMNAVMLGVETDYKASGAITDKDFVSNLMAISEVVFCVLFSLELMLRIAAYGCQFFVNRNWGWNVFDCIVVGFQVTEQVVHFLAQSHLSQNTGVMRALRVLRFVRITRLVRLVRLVEELHTIMTSIIASMMALFWTLLLLVMIIYISSVFFTQVALDLHDTKNIIKIDYYYGRLPRAILTMFEVIVGGVSWDEVLEPMIEDVSPVMGFIFCLYIAFCVFAMMNMATGVFVDRAIRKAQEDKDNYTANHISRLFFADANIKSADSSSPQITSEIFVKKIDTPDMQEYFKAINVDPSEAKGLFQLLDADNSGTVDAEELVNGCMRLRGQAKALELSLIRYDLNQMFRNLFKGMERTNKKLYNMNKVITDIQGRSHGGRHGLRESCPSEDGTHFLRQSSASTASANRQSFNSEGSVFQVAGSGHAGL